MSKTFSYVLLVIVVYLLIIFPKVVSKNSGTAERESSIVDREENVMRGHTA